MCQVVLVNIKTEVEWQLAFQAICHADADKKVKLTFGTPEGDISLSVQSKAQQTVIRKIK
jgi:hypothetical protein